MAKKFLVNDPNEAILVKKIQERNDVAAERIKKLLKLPDLTKKSNSPVKILFDQIIKLPRFKNFDLVDFPKIVTVEENLSKSLFFLQIIA